MFLDFRTSLGIIYGWGGMAAQADVFLAGSAEPTVAGFVQETLVAAILCVVPDAVK